MVSLGLRIRVARALLGKTRRELATTAGVGVSTLQTFEMANKATGKTKLKTVRAINDMGVCILSDGVKFYG